MWVGSGSKLIFMTLGCAVGVGWWWEGVGTWWMDCIGYNENGVCDDDKLWWWCLQSWRWYDDDGDDGDDEDDCGDDDGDDNDVDDDDCDISDDDDVGDIKGALDKYKIIPQLFPKKVGIFVLLEVLTWVMTVYWVLHSTVSYFWRNMNISSIFYFSKSTSINTHYSSLWDTLKMMLFTKYLIKWKHVHWQNQLEISALV